MPRKPRQKSALNIYHVILRGINKQIIFEDKADYLQFVNILMYYKEECNFKLFAYCLMDNHIHLLVEESDVSLDEIMKRIEVKFVRWYNKKYERIGYLFQDRYKSEPVNDEKYFLTVLRYIHQNPIHAGLESELGIYPWNSFHDYVLEDANFVDINTAINLFPQYGKCMEFMREISNEKCMEYTSGSRYSDTEALTIIKQKTSCQSPSDFQRLNLLERNRYLQMLYSSGLAIRQISRLTGISRTAINKVVH